MRSSDSELTLAATQPNHLQRHRCRLDFRGSQWYRDRRNPVAAPRAQIRRRVGSATGGQGEGETGGGRTVGIRSFTKEGLNIHMVLDLDCIGSATLDLFSFVQRLDVHPPRRAPTRARAVSSRCSSLGIAAKFPLLLVLLAREFAIFEKTPTRPAAGRRCRRAPAVASLVVSL